MLQVNRWRIATGLASLMIILMVAPLGVTDAMAIFDGLIILLTIAFTIVGVEVQQRGGGRFDRLFTRLSVPEPIVVLAGVAVLLVVSIRQYIQIASPDLVEATASINPDARSRYAIVQNYSYVWGWLLILWGVRPQIDLRAWWIRHKREVLPIIGLMTAGAAMRLIWLDDYPNILNGDDGLIGWWARTMYTEAGSLSYTLTAMDGVGTFYLTLLRGLIRTFGSEAWVVRFMPALAGISSIGAFYLLGRTLYGQRIGFLSALLLTFAHTHIHFSRQVAVSYIYAAIFLPVVLWGIWRLVATRKAWPAAVAAFMLTMHANFYVDAWAWAVLCGLILLSWLIVERQTVIPALPSIGLFVGLALLGFMPQLIWAAVLPEEFFSRLTTDGSFVSGWVYREAALNDTSVVLFVVYLYQMAFEAILTSPFIDFYHANVPILDVITAVLFFIGMAIVHNRIHTRRSMLVLGWFWGGMTALAVYTQPISSYHYRLFVIVPVLMLLAAIGLSWIWDKLLNVVPRRYALGSVAVVLGAIIAINSEVYVNRLALVCRYGVDPQTQRAGAAARFLAEKPVRDTEVIIVGQLNDVHAGTWKSFEYLNESIQFSNAWPDEQYDFVPFRGRDVYLLYIPERFPEREYIEQGLAPIGDYETITMCGELYGYLTHVRVP
jgi:hypothetical protein